MAKHHIHLKDGEILKNRYQIIKQIGSGGMSVVYLAQELNSQNRSGARHPNNSESFGCQAPEQLRQLGQFAQLDEGRLWAIKVADMENRISKRLFSEAKILSELDHPTLPKIADFFSSDDERYFYLVQEYVEGQSLYEIFERSEQYLEEEAIVDIGIQLCDVLQYLHTVTPTPVIYRDLKPANIMITDDGSLKLIDFGIARRFVHDKVKDTLQIGTVGFAAPEQFEKRQSDTRTDLFSLGALMYYLLTGGKYVYITQKPVQAFRKSITRKMRKCIRLLVKTEPDERIQSAEEVKDYLVDAKNEINQAKQSPFSNGWLIGRYIFSILFFIGVIFYIIFDQR